jgi:RNA polymerase sigma factor (sigma-70 family)
MPELDDHHLLADFVRDGSEAAFTELVRRHAGLVHSAALRYCGNPHHAEEIAQAVFIIFARKAKALSPRVVVSGWLYQTARLTAANFIKGEIRRRRREQEAVMQSNLNEPEPSDWGKIAALLDEAMGALGETDRNAVLLRYFENRTSPEIGASLRMNEETARKRVNRALEKLRQFFSKRRVTVSSTGLSGAISANSVQPVSSDMVKHFSAVALAKGATASTSTATLVKGALKLMAWTKAKTAIVASAAAILLVGTPAVVIIEAWPGPDIKGIWMGTVLLSGSGVHAGELPKTRFVFTVTGAKGHYQVTGADIDRGQKDVPVSFTYDYPHLHAEIPNSPDSFDGIVNRAGTKISGKWKEGNDSGPLVFEQTTNPPPFPEPLADADFVPRAGSALQGFWKGAIKIGRNNSLEVNIKITEDTDGTFRADFYVPPQGGGRQPTTVSYDGTTIKLMPMAGYGMFQGKLSNDGKQMVGDWIQDGGQLTTTLTRAN